VQNLGCRPKKMKSGNGKEGRKERKKERRSKNLHMCILLDTDKGYDLLHSCPLDREDTP